MLLGSARLEQGDGRDLEKRAKDCYRSVPPPSHRAAMTSIAPGAVGSRVALFPECVRSVLI